MDLSVITGSAGGGGTFRLYSPHPPPPFQYGKNFKIPLKNYPKLFCPPPLSMAKTFSANPLFIGVKLHLPQLNCIVFLESICTQNLPIIYIDGSGPLMDLSVITGYLDPLPPFCK